MLYLCDRRLERIAPQQRVLQDPALLDQSRYYIAGSPLPIDILAVSVDIVLSP